MVRPVNNQSDINQSDIKKLEFAIYCTVLNQTDKFSIDDVVKKYEYIYDKETVYNVSKRLLKRFMDNGIVQEHFDDTYSVIV